MKNSNRKVKNILLFLAVVALVFVAYYLGGKKNKEKDMIVEDNTVKTQMPEEPVAVSPIITSEKKSQKSSEKAYDIDIEYPVLSSVNVQSSVKEMNSRINSYLAQVKSEFMENANEMSKYNTETDVKSSLVMKYKVYGPVHGVETVAFDVSDYNAGAAHPNSYVRTLNFSTKTGKEISLTDMCADSSSCLSKLAPMYQAELKNKLLGMSMDYGDTAIDGSAARAGNYQVFISTKDTLDVVYNPYQVAPYAAGNIRVALPWDKVSVYLLPEYK